MIDEFLLDQISFPKGYKKRFWRNTPRLVTEEVTFPVKYYESVFDVLIYTPIFPTVNENFIRIFCHYTNK